MKKNSVKRKNLNRGDSGESQRKNQQKRYEGGKNEQEG